MVALGDRVSGCGCRQARIWTADGGLTWHPTAEGVGNGFVGAAGTLWWWRGGRLYQAAQWPPAPTGLRRRQVASLPGAIVDVKPVPDGVAALMTNRVAGVGIDSSPPVLFAQSPGLRFLRLPQVIGEVLVRSLDVAWPRLTVHGFDVTGFTRGPGGPRYLELARRRRHVGGDPAVATSSPVARVRGV